VRESERDRERDSERDKKMKERKKISNKDIRDIDVKSRNCL